MKRIVVALTLIFSLFVIVPSAMADGIPQKRKRKKVTSIQKKKKFGAAQCTPPGGNYNGSVIAIGTVVSWNNCFMVVRKTSDNTQINLFMGYSEKDTTPSIGQTVEVRYDPQTMQAFHSRFSGYPFVEPAPTPITYATVIGVTRPGARVVLNVNFSQPVRTADADAQGKYRFDNVQANTFIALTPQMQGVVFEPSVWSSQLATGSTLIASFSSHTHPYPAPYLQVKRIEIPVTTINLVSGQTVSLNTRAYDASNNLISPTPTLQYIGTNNYDFIGSNSRVYANWDAHLIMGGVVGTTQIYAQKPCGSECFDANGQYIPQTVKSNLVTVNVVAGPVPIPSPTPSPTPTPTPSPTPTPVPSPSPSPSPTPTPTNDTTPPVANMISPVGGASLSGVITIVGTATDNVVISAAYVIVDNVKVLSSNNTVNPYNWTLDTRQLNNGDHFMYVRAWDASNNNGDSSVLNFTVANGAPSPTPTPTPSPSPTPTPSPTPSPSPPPSPSPTPEACQMIAPASVIIPRKSSRTVSVSVQNYVAPVTVTAVPSTGQVTVQPTSRTIAGVSTIMDFLFTVKQNSTSVVFNSRCGSKTVQVIVQ